MCPCIVGILGHAEESFEEFGVDDIGGVEGGLGGVGKPEEAMEEDWSDAGPEELKHYWKREVLDGKSIADVSDPGPGFGYCHVKVFGEGELGGECETDIVTTLDNFNWTIVDAERSGRQMTFVENHGLCLDGVDLKAVLLTITVENIYGILQFPGWVRQENQIIIDAAK